MPPVKGQASNQSGVSRSLWTVLHACELTNITQIMKPLPKQLLEVQEVANHVSQTILKKNF